MESGFVVNAKSRANAQGVWQFMKGTAKQYGLVVDSYMDEKMIRFAQQRRHQILKKAL